MRLILSMVLILGSLQAFAQSNEELAKRIEILSEEISMLKAHQMKVTTNKSVYGLGRSASKVYHVPQGFSIGGYGEITYNQFAAENEDGDPINLDAESEVLRYVLYFGYKFSDKWVVNTEIEIEHVNKVYTEFAYLDYLHSQELNFRSGLVLIPFGYINEAHEPAMFPSVLRPYVETKIVPTTWRENGLGFFGTLGSVDYKAFLVNGMNADDMRVSSGPFRGGRKRGGTDNANDNQNASTGAIVLRADHRITDNLTYGATVYTGEASATARDDNTVGGDIDLPVTMLEAHAEWNYYENKLRALFVQASIDKTKDWNDAVATDAQKLPSLMQGFYLEYSRRVFLSGQSAITPFVRYERYDLNLDYEDNYVHDQALDNVIYTAGVSYSPFDQITFKADMSQISNKAQTGVTQYNLGIGYNF